MQYRQSCVYRSDMCKFEMEKNKIKNIIYSQVHKYWDIDTILTFLALYTTTMDFKWNEQDAL